jgi:hypothetical protein
VKKVWMRHPGLPDREPRQFAESSVPFHVNAGWEVVDSPEEGGGPTEQQQVDDTEAKDDARGASTRKRAAKSAEDKKEDGS